MILNNKKLSTFSLRSEQGKDVCSPYSIYHCHGSPSRLSKAKKRNIMQTCWKGRNKCVSIFRLHDYVCRKGIIKIFVEVMSSAKSQYTDQHTQVNYIAVLLPKNMWKQKLKINTIYNHSKNWNT